MKVPRGAVLVLWLAACGCASVTRVTAPTGPPEILNRWWNETLPPMDLPRYEQELLHQANRANLVPVHEWPADLPAEAPRFLLNLNGAMITLALRGDAASGFALLADSDANGKLDEPEVTLHRSGDAWIATMQARDVWMDARWEKVPSFSSPEPAWTLQVCSTNVRRGTIQVAGRKRAFAVTGRSGKYDGESEALFLDLDGDGRLALDAGHSDERFRRKEERVVLGHTAYEFSVEPSGDALTLTRLPGRYEPRPSLAVGARASSFSLEDLEGHRRSLDEFRGKVVLLDFWTLGCAFCIWEMPELAKLRAEHGELGFEIVGIHVGPAVPQVAATCAAKGADWPQLVDGNHAVANLYRVEGYPTKFLLDRKGRILGHGVGGVELAAAIETALAR